jgi:hypothetical protein
MAEEMVRAKAHIACVDPIGNWWGLRVGADGKSPGLPITVIVSTGDIGPEARRYANKVMADSNLCIVMLDGGDLALIESRPAAIVDVFTREARHAMDLKKLEI